MTETETNRRWLMSSRVRKRDLTEQQRQDAETLLYYQTQLEAELTYVRGQLVSLGLGATSAP